MAWAALLTPPGRGALAVVGLGGASGGELLGRLFRPHGGKGTGEGVRVGRWEPVTPGTAGEEVMVVTCAAEGATPAHEIHCHGGAAAPAHVLAGLAAAGAEIVEWREFLLRAGATEVEIEAREALCRVGGPRAAAILGRQLGGALDRALGEVRALAAVEPRVARERACRLRAAARIGLRLSRPWRVVVAGPANVGKSSLVNRLVGHARSLVSPVPGTTRDVVATTVVLDGWEVELVDTAGLRGPAEPVGPTEAAGIAAARHAAAAADLVLRLSEIGATDQAVEPGDLSVITKADRDPGAATVAAALVTSAVTGRGIDSLVAAILERLVPEERSDPGLLAGPVPFTPRQVAGIEALLASLPDG